MKPRNKYEKNIVKLSKRYRRILTHSNKNFIKKKMPKLVVFKYSKHVCTECNHRWHDNMSQTRIMEGIKCPNCKEGLKLCEYKSSRYTEEMYFGKLDIYEGYQLYRMFVAYKHIYPSSKPTWHFIEVQRHFINVEGRLTSLSFLRGGWNAGYGSWHSGLQVRASPTEVGAHHELPGMEILPEIYRNGLNDKLLNEYYPEKLMSRLLCSPKHETIIKYGRPELIKWIMTDHWSDWTDHWDSIKIAMRHNYHFDDTRMWFEQMKLLKKYKQDLRNPKNICPEDLRKEHSKYLLKERRARVAQNKRDAIINRAKEKAKKIKEIRERKNNFILFKKHIDKYRHLVFREDDIQISLLKTVKEFEREGVELDHCVNDEEYYFDFDSLIFSATVKGKRTETIQYIISSNEIEQCRGYDNVPSEHHDRIVSLMSNNLDSIKPRRVKRKKKVLTKLKQVA